MFRRTARLAALGLAACAGADVAAAQASDLLPHAPPDAVPLMVWTGGDDPVAPPARSTRQVPGVGAEVIPGLSPIVAPPRRSKGTVRPKRAAPRSVEEPSLLRRA